MPAVITEWNNLDISMCNSSSQNFEDLKLLIKTKLGLINLEEHKVSHDFKDCLNHICCYGQEIETTNHFHLYCVNYRCARKTFFEKINFTDFNIIQQNVLSITNDLLFDKKKLENGKSNAL